MCLQAADIQARVTELMRSALARAIDPKDALQPGDLLRLSATVRVLEELSKVPFRVLGFRVLTSACATSLHLTWHLVEHDSICL